jgi:hypothetical protein
LTIDLLDTATYLPPSENNIWFLKVYDRHSFDEGGIVGFNITYQGITYSSTDVPVPICDFQTSYAFLPSIEASASIYIEHTWVGDLNVTVGVGDPSSPLWSQVVWNRQGGNQHNLNLTVGLSNAFAYLSPSVSNPWYLRVYDGGAGDQGRVVTFNITYQGITYSSTDVPVAIYDFRASYAYVQG